MKPAHILIADDERNIRIVVRAALAAEGYTVEEAADGAGALEAIGKRVPDLLILDLTMPVLDGMGVLQRLKAMPSSQKPPAIVLTAYGSIPAAVKATRMGAVDFLEKPVTPEDLLQAVAGALKAMEPYPPHRTLVPLGGYGNLLEHVRSAIRLNHLDKVETLLMRAADLSGRDPAYFNLLGVLYELQGDERLARKFYGKAIAARRDYAPAQQNMRRLYEFESFGHSDDTVALGDEADLLSDWGTPIGG